MQITREQIIVIPVGPSRNNIGMDQCLHSPEIWSILFHKISYVIYNGLHVANLIKKCPVKIFTRFMHPLDASQMTVVKL